MNFVNNLTDCSIKYITRQMLTMSAILSCTLDMLKPRLILHYGIGFGFKKYQINFRVTHSGYFDPKTRDVARFEESC